MKRQPSVVSCNFISPRAKAASGLPSTKGARVMLSTPPATMTSPSPRRIALAAVLIACRPEPQSRLTVCPATVDRQPGQQQRHARDVAVVLTGLVGAAQNHILDGLWRDARARRPPRRSRARPDRPGAYL